jgi:hypothetical protein
MSEPAVLEKPPVSIWKRLFLGAALFVLAMVVLGLVQHYWQRSRDGSALERAMAELDEIDPHWQLEEIEEARPAIPDERNSARTVVAAHRLLPRKVFDDTFLNRFKLLPLPVLLDEEHARLLEAEMKSADPAAIEARKLADMPEGRHRLAWRANPIMTTLDDQQSTRAVATLLQYDALHLAQTGKHAEALRSCRAILNAGRSLDDEPLVISQLIRIACVYVAASSAEQVLALGEPPVEELVALQQLAELEERHASIAVGYRGERALLHRVFTGIAEDRIDMRDMPVEKGADMAFRERWARWTLRRQARAEHPRMLKMLTRIVDVARLPTHEQATAEGKIRAELNALPDASLIRTFLPGLTSLGDAGRRKVAYMRCVKTMMALERYRRDRGTWPVTLDELAPGLLKAVPLDPFDGKPLRYKRLADGVLVYSVGTDGVDNGGIIDRTRFNSPGTDIGYQLWDFKYRRQKPVPAPKVK